MRLSYQLCRPLLCHLFLFCFSCSFSFGQWAEHRGPNGQGHSDSSLPTTWSVSTNITWATEIPGRGYSSPVILGDQVWVTSAIEFEETDEAALAERLKENTGGQPVQVLKKVQLFAVCLDRETGEIIHNTQLIEKENPQWVHELNSYASPTPVLEAGRLYCHFGSYGSAAVDTKTGKRIWLNTDVNVMHENGPASSPVVVGDHFIFHADGSDKQFIYALNKHTGKTAWKVARSGEMHENPQLKKAYGTPVVLGKGGRAEIISPAANWLYCYDPRDGKEKWKLAYGDLGFSNVSRPVLGDGMIFTSTCFMKAKMLGIRYDGLGEEPVIEWEYAKGVPSTPSPILVGDELYFTDEKIGFLTCLDAETGKLNYKERLGGKYMASPIHANGLIYFVNNEGKAAIVKAGPEFELVSEPTVDEPVLSSPAALDGAIYLRTKTKLYRIEE